MVYSPDAHGSLLFGGASPTGLVQDTWLYSGGSWSELIAGGSCSPSTCPSARVDAMMAYDAADYEAVLFGGLNQYGLPAGLLNDTWTFAGGAWTNITSTAGPSPPARYDGSMTFDSGDGFVLLFGGGNSTGMPFNDTWQFRGGRWTNLTASLPIHPEARLGAAIANSPLGYVMLFGGLGPTSLVQNNYVSTGGPYVVWWFHNGSWIPAYTPVNPHAPSSLSGASELYGPCGRLDAALAWSPKNGRFVLFGGTGVPGTTFSCGSTIFLFPLNDTFVYTGPLGGWFTYWYNDTTVPAPTPRGSMAYDADFSAGYFLLFGGSTGFGGGPLNETWRYFQRVSVKFSGPLTIQTGQLGFDVFTLKAVGGSGLLDYSANATPLKTANTITNCPELTDGQTRPVPSSGYIQCAPPPSSYNIYRFTVNVWDSLNASDRASANWTVTVQPPEALQLFSQFKGYFYEGFQVNDIFGVYAQIDNAPVTQLSVSLQGFTLSMSHSNSSQLWWNSTPFDMGQIGPGAVLQVTASTSSWAESKNLSVSVISVPDWLQQLASLSGVIQSQSTSGTGAWNLSYSLTQQVSIPIGKIFNFSLPIPLVSGNYSLVPSLQFTFKESSSANVTLSGQFALSTPSISLGAFNLTLSASVQVSGTFNVVHSGPDLSTIDWVQASVTISVKGDFSGSFPIYGFSFNFLGAEVKVGFTLDVDIAPAIAVQLLMLPTSSSTDQVVQGFGLTVSQVLGSFTFPLSADVSFGIGIASVAVGGTISVALNFEVSPGPFAVQNIWVNGTLSVSAQVLFWSGSWDLVGPGIIYHGVPNSLLPGPRAVRSPLVGYDNGSDAVWSVQARYYNTSGYDALAWNSTSTSGTAVSNVYPDAQLTAAPTSDGAYVFFTDDRVALPVGNGLTVSGLRLDGGSNALTALPTPSDPGYAIAGPRATTLPDGSLYVVWSAVPLSESTASSPLGLSAIALHGARFFPVNESWGPTHVWSSSGFAESYAVDGNSPDGTLALLRSPTLLPTETSPEWLSTYDLSSGALYSNFSTAGISSIEGLDGASSWAIVRGLDGNLTVLNPQAGTADQQVPGTGLSPNALLSASFVTGSPGSVLLRYRTPTASLLELFDLTTGTPIATIPDDASVTDAHAVYGGGIYYVVASSASGLAGWQIAGSVVANLTTTPRLGISRFDLVQVGASLLADGLATTVPGSQPTKALQFVEISAALPPLPAERVPSPPTATSSNDGFYLAILGSLAVASAVILAVVAWRARRRTPPLAPSGVPSAAAQPPSPPPGAG